MNFIGHGVVAHATHPGEPLRTFGAMVPDLRRTMVLTNDLAENLAIASGISCHHVADHAFHRQQQFIAGSTTLREMTLSAGLTGGASRVVGHLGFELLFDETLLSTTNANEVVANALISGAAVVRDQDPSGAQSAAELVRIAALKDHEGPTSSLVLARRLAYFTAGRPRVSIDSGVVAVVASLLDAVRSDVASVSASVLAEVIVACANVVEH